jgi:hypothetical protein
MSTLCIKQNPSINLTRFNTAQINGFIKSYGIVDDELEFILDGGQKIRWVNWKDENYTDMIGVHMSGHCARHRGNLYPKSVIVGSYDRSMKY